MRKPVGIWKNVRGRRTEEDANPMPDEDFSSHRSSVFTQITEKKRKLSFAKTMNAAFSFFLLLSKKTAAFQTLTFSLYRVRAKMEATDDNALSSR